MARPQQKDEHCPSIKDEARRLLDQLPDDVSWGDVVYAFHVRAGIERGLKDSDAGRVTPVTEVRKKFGLPK